MALPPPTNLPPPSLLDLPLPDPAAYEGEPQEYARALMQRRDEIEREVVCLCSLQELSASCDPLDFMDINARSASLSASASHRVCS